MREFIRDYNERFGATVLLTSHYMDDVAALCPRVIVIDHGHAHLRRRPAASWCARVRPDKRVTIRLSAPVDRARARRAGRRWSSATPRRRCCRCRPRRPARSCATRWPRCRWSTSPIEDPPLEEVMRELFQPRRAHRPATAHGRARRPHGAPPCIRARDRARFPTLLRVGLAEVVAYRAEFLVWILTTNMPLVMLALWHAVAADGPVGRFDQTQFTPTTWRCWSSGSLTSNWMAWQMSMEIRDGTLSTQAAAPDAPAATPTPPSTWRRCRCASWWSRRSSRCCRDVRGGRLAAARPGAAACPAGVAAGRLAADCSSRWCCSARWRSSSTARIGPVRALAGRALDLLRATSSRSSCCPAGSAARRDVLPFRLHARLPGRDAGRPAVAAAGAAPAGRPVAVRRRLFAGWRCASGAPACAASPPSEDDVTRAPAAPLGSPRATLRLFGVQLRMSTLAAMQYRVDFIVRGRDRVLLDRR